MSCLLFHRENHVFASSTPPSPSKRVTQLPFLLVQPSIRNFNTASSLQSSTVDCRDNPPSYRDVANFGNCSYVCKSIPFQETISEMCIGSTLDPIHVKHGYGKPVPALNNGNSMPDVSTHVFQVGGGGCVTAQLPTQHLECPAEMTSYTGGSLSPKHSFNSLETFPCANEFSHPN